MGELADHRDEVEQWCDELADAGAVAALPAMIDLLRRRSGIDFSGYKSTTLARRLQKRMAVHGFADTADYIALLADDTRGESECTALGRDLLINVTEFFRDAEVFHQLAEEILPDLLRGRDAADDLRIWSAGCASGEEAYSLALLALECAGRMGFDGNVKVFATDLHGEVLGEASRGIYPAEAVSKVPEALLRRYFQRSGDEWQVVPACAGMSSSRATTCSATRHSRASTLLSAAIC